MCPVALHVLKSNPAVKAGTTDGRNGGFRAIACHNRVRVQKEVLRGGAACGGRIQDTQSQDVARSLALM